MEQKKLLAHHVFFWLKNPDSKEDFNKLLEGLRSLKPVDALRGLHIGIPAETEKRPVIDDSYQVSALMFFDNLAGQDAYQIHPLHKNFVENYAHLWQRVLIYDSMDL